MTTALHGLSIKEVIFLKLTEKDDKQRENGGIQSKLFSWTCTNR